MNTAEFDDIRPYHDEELPVIFKELLADADFRKVIAAAFPEVPLELLEQKINSCKTKNEFQIGFSYALIKKLVQKFADEVILDHT